MQLHLPKTKEWYKGDDLNEHAYRGAFPDLEGRVRAEDATRYRLIYPSNGIIGDLSWREVQERLGDDAPSYVDANPCISVRHKEEDIIVAIDTSADATQRNAAERDEAQKLILIEKLKFDLNQCLVAVLVNAMEDAVERSGRTEVETLIAYYERAGDKLHEIIRGFG